MDTTGVAIGGASEPRRSRKALAALVLAIAGWLFGIALVPLLCLIAAIVQGVRARREIRADPALGGGRMATIGIVLGASGLLFYTALFVALRLSSGWGGANTLA
jgi:hypothetical protein